MHLSIYIYVLNDFIYKFNYFFVFNYLILVKTPYLCILEGATFKLVYLFLLLIQTE